MGVGAWGWIGGAARASEALRVRAGGGPFRTPSTSRGIPQTGAPPTPGENGVVLTFGGGVWSSVLCPRSSGLGLCVALRCLYVLCVFRGLVYGLVSLAWLVLLLFLFWRVHWRTSLRARAAGAENGTRVAEGRISERASCDGSTPMDHTLTRHTRVSVTRDFGHRYFRPVLPPSAFGAFDWSYMCESGASRLSDVPLHVAEVP
eukprot:6858262-Prymnesium_polylepis.1